MSEYREQAIKDVAEIWNKILLWGYTSACVDTISDYAVAQRERVLRLKAALTELLEIVRPHNPQDPDLVSYEECPIDHPNCCGVCELVYQARAALSEAV